MIFPRFRCSCCLQALQFLPVSSELVRVLHNGGPSALSQSQPNLVSLSRLWRRRLAPLSFPFCSVSLLRYRAVTRPLETRNMNPRQQSTKHPLRLSSSSVPTRVSPRSPRDDRRCSQSLRDKMQHGKVDGGNRERCLGDVQLVFLNEREIERTWRMTDLWYQFRRPVSRSEPITPVRIGLST